MQYIVTVCGIYQVGEGEFVTDRLSKIITDADTIPSLLDWAKRVTGEPVSINELKFSQVQE